MQEKFYFVSLGAIDKNTGKEVWIQNFSYKCDITFDTNISQVMMDVVHEQNPNISHETHALRFYSFNEING